MLIKNKKIISVATQRPLRKNIKYIFRRAGRNNQGRLVVRHQGGGVKQLYRVIDWNRTHADTLVVNFEYDPNRSACIAKIAKMDKTSETLEKEMFSYILAVKGMRIFDRLQTIKNKQRNIFLRPGDSSILENFETGDFLNCVEVVPNQGALFARAAGTGCQVLQASVVNKIKLRLPSGDQRLFSFLAKATLGVISNSEHSQKIIGKAGRNRWLNHRPTVRGVAMNPVDHPHGGGQGKTKGGRPSVTPQSRITKGLPTRNPRKKNKLLFLNKNSNKI